MEYKIKLTIGAIITLALAISGTYYLVDNDEAYYCESRDLVMICEKLSSGIGTRCYYENTYKTCKEGWVKIEIGQEVQVETLKIPLIVEGIKWECSPSECVRIKW